MKKSGTRKFIENLTIGLVTITLLGLLVWTASKEHRDGPSHPNETTEVIQKTYIVDQAIAQSASTPIGGDLYEIRWMNDYNDRSLSYTEHGTAITSYKDIKVGDQVSIKQSMIAGAKIQYITDWKTSGTTSW